MKRAVRTLARPPAIMLMPRHSRTPVEGRDADEAAASRRSRVRAQGVRRGGSAVVEPIPGNGVQEFLLLAPGGRAADGIVEVLVEAASSFSSALTRRRMLLTTRYGARRSRGARADHGDDLAAAGDEIGEEPGFLVGQRTDRRLGGVEEAGDEGGVDGSSWRAGRWRRRRHGRGRMTSATGMPAAMRPAETTVSKPPGPRSRPLGARGGERATRAAMPSASRGTAKASPLGGCGRRGVLETSMRRGCVHLVLPCASGLRLRPKRLFGFDGTADGDPGFSTGSIAQGAAVFRRPPRPASLSGAAAPDKPSDTLI